MKQHGRAGFGALCCALLAASLSDVRAAQYRLDAAKSRLEFSGTQAGARFNAVIKSFKAAISFDPSQLANSHIEIDMDLASADSQDAERDETMRGADFFYVQKFSKARYVTREFSKTAAGYSATGSLTLRGVTRDVPIQFTLSPPASGVPGSTSMLVGHAQVKRLEFGVGQGEWKSTQWVGNDVEVKFKLALSADLAASKSPNAAGGR